MFAIHGNCKKLTKIWFWGWARVDIDYKYKKLSRDLLNYGLDISLDDNNLNNYNTDNLFIRTLFVNTKLKFDYQYQLDIFLAICCYISKTNISNPHSSLFVVKVAQNIFQTPTTHFLMLCPPEE